MPTTRRGRGDGACVCANADTETIDATKAVTNRRIFNGCLRCICRYKYSLLRVWHRQL